METAGSNDRRKRDDPPPEEIEQLTAEIRSRWSAAERRRRKPNALGRQPASIPVVQLQDLLGHP